MFESLPPSTSCRRDCSLRQRLFLKSASALASFTHATVRTDSGHSNQKTSRRSLQKEATCVLDRAAHWGCRFNHEPFAPKAVYQQAVYQQAVYNRFVCYRVKIQARKRHSLDKWDRVDAFCSQCWPSNSSTSSARQLSPGTQRALMLTPSGLERGK